MPDDQPRPVLTASGLEVAPVYGPDAAFDPEEALGVPGAPPFTRGIRADGYRTKGWTMRQYAGFGSAEETNRRFRYLLERGQTGLSVAFDLPTQMGYDSDDPMAAGRSAGSACRSTRSPTWSCSSRASTSPPSPRR